MTTERRLVPVAWLRDLDGTGSLHPAAHGDPGAFPVYSRPSPVGVVGEIVERSQQWHEDASESAWREQQGIAAVFRTHEASEMAVIKLRDAIGGSDRAAIEVFERRAVEALNRHRAALTAALTPAAPVAVCTCEDERQCQGCPGGRAASDARRKSSPPVAAGLTGEESITVSRADLLKVLDGNLAAASEALAVHTSIDFIEEHGGADSEDDLERVAYHLFYTLHAAERLRRLSAQGQGNG